MQKISEQSAQKKPMPNSSENIRYEFTQDQALWESYFDIRERCYKQHWGLKVFSGAEDADDRHGHIVIAKHGSKVIGGGRIVFRYSNKTNALLPMETEDFKLHEVIPELSKEPSLLGEIGRVAVLPEYRGKKISTIGFYLLAKAQSLGCRYLLTVTPHEQAIAYIKAGINYGLNIKMHENIPIADHPYYNNLNMKLLVCDIKNLPSYQFLLTQE